MSVDTASPAGSPGSVGDRYRLLECVAGDPDGPAVAWRAWDTLLARPVTLTVVRPGGAGAAGFLGHAHAVSTIVHPALARVYDAVDEGSRAYVVSEWVTGTPLTALLRDGALEPDVAASTVARVAEGVAAAHGAGIAFGGVHPDHVVVTPGGTVTLAQVVGDGRATTTDDVRGLGALLYAALTAHWPLAPTGGAAALRPATTNSGHVLTPRQVRAGVPEDLSTLAMRALDQGSPQGVRSAAAIAAVLGDRAGPAEEMFPLVGDEREHRRRPRWLVLAAPVTAGLLALAAVGWVIGAALGRFPVGDDDRSTPPASASPTTPGGASTRPATPQAVRPQNGSLYDPEGDGSENVDEIGQSFDGNPATSWSTVNYRRNATFGNLKSGMGIAYQFSAPTAFRQVQVSGTDGIDVEIRAGNSPPAGAPVSQFPTVGQARGLTGTQTIRLRVDDPAQYYVVWITKLAPTSDGQFSAALAEVKFLR